MDTKRGCGHGEEKTYHPEPSYARENIKKGEFGIGYFHGQTHLFVPKSIGIAIGMRGLLDLADQIFGKDVMTNFHPRTDEKNYEQSYFIELPPQENMEDNQVTKLILAIKDRAQKISQA